MNIVLILAMIVLLLLVVLPFLLGAPRVSKDQRLIQGMLPPGNRRYTLVKPKEMPAGQELPLVIALHFGGHGMPFYGELFLEDFIEPALKELGAIMVAPDCPSKDWTQPKSEQIVLDLLDWAVDQFPVDPNRIILAGFSMGGVGVWHLIKRFPTRFSSALIMAAKPPEGSEELAWDGSIYVLHGRDDELFPLVDANRIVVALEERGINLRYRILETTTHYETHKYRAPLSESVPWIQKHWG
jgi:predicted peptidase